MGKRLITLLLASALAGCAGTHAAGTGKDGPGRIELLITADPQLNQFQRTPHALLLCLYQLKDPNGFQQLAQDQAGAPRLMECTRFDETVVNAGQVVVQPGQELRQTRNRGEGTRYLGIATGYYSLGRKRVTELSLISTKSGAPAGSMVRIDLGPHEIRNVRVE